DQPVQFCFYTNLTGYASNAAGFNSHLFINTPLTASTNGEIYFAYRAIGVIPAPINSGASGFVRIDADGNGTFVTATNGSSQMNRAPALSNDGSMVYFASGFYLVGFDSQTLATKFVRRIGPQNNTDMATASPTVGPDGDVYMGWAGELFHFGG